MNQVLIDSSVWIEYFRNSNSQISLEVDKLIDLGNIYTNELILTELIPFLKLKKQSQLIQIMGSLESFEMFIDWKQIIEFQTTNLKNGINKIGIPDLLILQNAIQNEGILFTLDKHFKLMSKIHKLKLYN
ncbi:PIN domain-containing protein [Leptospira meyeri]|uniref:PIN domain-containing protein n=1 Tax=Leptospira meyeri TaxID=29508 RepID=UPI000C2A9559|nr:PIN domain-containing protein [Leptospira meyeri]PKA21947.1 PIN domain nuclease [Leptospira sp. mixed culture ATI2-C-A1]MCW7490617.1 PIN domain-containing protein [Leptospira meyeri]PJZ80447.1 PIN domain nuclease [Leptospira meyeri]PJZ95817.1 PIN domain nuclease [Leptospira meyeri]PKA13218.1 PIN domain nuclease [Leptospira meyeri]